jgi:hypothetical protein
MNTMASGAAFQISYPATVGSPASITTCNVVYNSVTYPMTCALDATSRTVKMSGGLSSVAIPKGASI